MQSDTQEIWYLLVQRNGEAHQGTAASKVTISSTADIDDLRKAIKAENRNKLANINATDLNVFKSVGDLSGEPLDEETQMCAIGKNASGKEAGGRKADALLVLVPGPLASSSASTKRALATIEREQGNIARAGVFALAVRVAIDALTSISRATVGHDASGAMFLRFESVMFLNNRTYETLLIRDCYFKVLEAGNVCTLSDDGSVTFSPRSYATILGSPGIGKSMLLWSLAYFLYRSGVVVCYFHFSLGPNCVVMDPATGYIGLNGFPKLGKGKKLAALFDSVEPHFAGFDIAVLVISPGREELSNQFKKCYGHRMLYMGPWSRREFDQYAAVCLNGAPLGPTFDRRYELFGGIPWRLFNPSNLTPDQELDLVISSLGHASHILIHVGGCDATATPSNFHDCIHMVPWDNYTRYQYQSASSAILKRLYDGCAQVDFAAIGKTIKYTRHFGAPVFAGDLFKVYALDILHRGGTFAAKKLKSDEGRGGIFAAKKLKSDEASKISFAKIEPSLMKGCDAMSDCWLSFYVSTGGNEAVVVFSIQNRLMKTTCSVQHGFKVNSSNYEWLAKYCDSKNCSICFVVPAYLVDSYAVQKVEKELVLATENLSQLDADKVNCNIESAYQKVIAMDQWVVGIDL